MRMIRTIAPECCHFHGECLKYLGRQHEFKGTEGKSAFYKVILMSANDVCYQSNVVHWAYEIKPRLA